MTQDQKHTPAPWRYNKINHFITAFKQNKEPVICEMARIPEFEANASLIAAAPELLDALEYCAANSADIDLDYIEGVINKAKG